MKRSDYEKLAEEIVDNLAKGESLEDGVVTKAKEKSMNPEQVKRLIEMTNTGAFLRLFKSLSGDDRMVDFDVADPSSVLKKFYAGGSPQVIKKTVVITMSNSDDSDFFTDIKDELRGQGHPEETSDSGSSLEEAKETKVAEEVPRGLPKFRVARMRDELLDKIAHAEYTASELADQLSGSFKGIYSREKLASFEADCITLHGNKAIPALTAIRSRIGSTSLDYSKAKTASVNRIVDAKDASFSKVAEYISTADSYLAASKALRILNNLEELDIG
jgi:hypothetical protein